MLSDITKHINLHKKVTYKKQVRVVSKPHKLTPANFDRPPSVSYPLLEATARDEAADFTIFFY